MSNQNAYIADLGDLEKAIETLLRAVPVGKKKQELAIREEAERVASDAKALIGCMKNDYIIAE